MIEEPPSQSHSDTSISSAQSLPRWRVRSQEKWVYETLRLSRHGLADWQSWVKCQPFGLFDKLSSLRRARIGLVWVSRKIGATPWHPVEDSGQRIVDPNSGKPTTVWRLKSRYWQVPYDNWSAAYRNLARGRVEDPEGPV
jgi:hypothetical protein